MDTEAQEEFLKEAITNLHTLPEIYAELVMIRHILEDIRRLHTTPKHTLSYGQSVGPGFNIDLK